MCIGHAGVALDWGSQWQLCVLYRVAGVMRGVCWCCLAVARGLHLCCTVWFVQQQGSLQDWGIRGRQPGLVAPCQALVQQDGMQSPVNT